MYRAEPHPTAGGLMTKQRGHRLLAGVAIMVQVLLLYSFLVMGLGWGGFWYLANLVQALVILVVAAVLIFKRPLLVLPLPVLSLLLMLAFQAVDPSTKITECTEAELAAAAQLPPPPGTSAPDFQSEPHNGCIARFETDVSGEELFEHYRRAARQAGWTVEEPGPVQLDPGEEAPMSPGPLGLSNEAITAAVYYEQAGDEGPARERLWVVVEVHERQR